MADLNKARAPKAPIVLNDGKERFIKLNLNALAELEEMYGEVQACFDALDKGSFKAIRALLWAGFLEDEPEIKLTEVGKLIDLDSMEDLMHAIQGVVDNSVPDAETQSDPPTMVVDGVVIQSAVPNAQIPQAVGEISGTGPASISWEDTSSNTQQASFGS